MRLHLFITVRNQPNKKTHEKHLNAHRIPTILEGIAAPPRAVSDHVVAGRHNDSTRSTCVQTVDSHHGGLGGVKGDLLYYLPRRTSFLVGQQLAIHIELHHVVTGG
jgi:hypothetical protein